MRECGSPAVCSGGAVVVIPVTYCDEKKVRNTVVRTIKPGKFFIIIIVMNYSFLFKLKQIEIVVENNKYNRPSLGVNFLT